MPRFISIRQVAASGMVSENFLRRLVARGECPGIWNGTRFLVNLDALTEQLDTESRRMVKVTNEEREGVND